MTENELNFFEVSSSCDERTISRAHTIRQTAATECNTTSLSFSVLKWWVAHYVIYINLESINMDSRSID